MSGSNWATFHYGRSIARTGWDRVICPRWHGVLVHVSPKWRMGLPVKPKFCQNTPFIPHCGAVWHYIFLICPGVPPSIWSELFCRFHAISQHVLDRLWPNYHHRYYIWSSGSNYMRGQMSRSWVHVSEILWHSMVTLISQCLWMEIDEMYTIWCSGSD